MLSKIATETQNKNSTRAEKHQILTMTPENWSRGKAASVFSVSERMVQNARKLLDSTGVCSLPPLREGKSISKDAIQKVKKFLGSSENCRIMPGMKDLVSVGKNQYELN